jgi:hypothetical protein
MIFIYEQKKTPDGHEWSEDRNYFIPNEVLKARMSKAASSLRTDEEFTEYI